jgi:hypothetical protein
MTKPKLTTKNNEIQSLKERVFDLEKQVDALNTAIVSVAICANINPKRLTKLSAEEYLAFFDGKIVPIIQVANGFIHQLIEEKENASR